MIDEKSEAILDQLYPPFAEKLRQLLAALGDGWKIDEGFRSFDQQVAYYAQGRSRPGGLITRDRAGYSGHNYGTAAHVRPATSDNAAFLKLATEAQNLGLSWGGNDQTGKFVEMSRVEMSILSMDECLALFKKGQLPAVWAAFDSKLKVPPIANPELPAEPEIEAETVVAEAPAPAKPVSAVVARRAVPKKAPVKKR